MLGPGPLSRSSRSGQGLARAARVRDGRDMSEKDHGVDGMTDEQKLRDQFLRAEHSTEADAAPRIEVTEHEGNVRIDIADTAAVRPGPGPGVDGADDSSADLHD